MIKTVIVEDNMLVQRHLVNILGDEEDFDIIGVYRDAFEAEEHSAADRPDLVVMDVQTLHNHSGLSASERIRARIKNTRVVIVTSLIDPDVLGRARTCADSLWYKDQDDAELINVLRRTARGESVFPHMSPSVELKDMFTGEISPRQIAILRRYVMGMTYDEIAAELKLSKNGVRWNLDRIVEKGGFQNKHEMLAAVIENKLIVTTLKETDE